MKIMVPKVSYEVESYVDANIGDTFTIEDTNYAPTLYLTARVTEQEICFTDSEKCKTIFDNFEEKQSQISSALISEMNKMIELKKVYESSIVSSNGVLFKNDSDSTKLTALVKDNGVDITSKYSIVWYKDDEQLSTSQTITVSASDLSDKAVYRFKALSGEILKATAEVTLMRLQDGPKGEDAIMLYIDSSNGTTFKNSDVATIFTVSIYVGGIVIDNSTKLKKIFGENSYLQWLIKKHGEKDFTKIPLNDSRLNDNGFMFTLNAKDIKFKAVFNCELNI